MKEQFRRSAAAVLLCVLAALCLAPRAGAQERPPTPPVDGEGKATEAEAAPRFPVSFGASITFASAFVWRGFVLGSDPALQPSVWAGIGPVTVTSWSNTYLPSAGRMTYSEHDLTVDYSREVRGVTLSFGWTNYAYAHVTTGRYSNEFYAAVTGGGYLRPKVQVYQDVHEGDGTYAMLAVSHDYEHILASSKVTLTPTISLGYNNHQWTERSGFSDVTAGVSLTLPTPVSRLALQPFLGYSCGLQADVFPRRFYGGVTLAVQ